MGSGRSTAPRRSSTAASTAPGAREKIGGSVRQGSPPGGVMPQPVLVVVDVQERLFNAMDAERRDEMGRNIKILGATARRLGLPVLVTEQYPKGLGHTLPELRPLLDDVTPIVKSAFSWCEARGLTERLRALSPSPATLACIQGHVRV